MSKKIIARVFLPLPLLFVPLLIAPLLFGCGEDAPTEPMAGQSIAAGKTEAGMNGAPGFSQANANQTMVDWCKAKSGREDENCACILDVVRFELGEADFAVVAEVADADLVGESSEEEIEAGFNEKFGTERMLSITQAFVEARASAEASCARSDKGPSDEERV